MDKKRRSSGSVILAMAIVAWFAPEPSSAGSCRAAKLCCQGRDSGCVIQKASPNAIIETPRDKPCYCDHACLKLGDCCDDFNETCAVSDCSVSDWSKWSECNNKCGVGHQTRSRFIVRPVRNGGKPCPETEQSLTCQNYDACRRRARRFQVEEASFSPGKSKEASLDSNFVPQVTGGEQHYGRYCAAFTILKISRGCKRRLESFHEGSRVCVWCREAQEGRRSEEESGSSSCRLERESPTASFAGIGRWELRGAVKHCHGKWMADPYGPIRENCSVSECQGIPLLAFL